jgi:hypothetical protein
MLGKENGMENIKDGKLGKAEGAERLRCRGVWTKKAV